LHMWNKERNGIMFCLHQQLRDQRYLIPNAGQPHYKLHKMLSRKSGL
jgi:hypothetical protein